MAFCVGLTGPIASGKTTVAGYFAQWGVDLIYADTSARQVTAQGTIAYHHILEHFGESYRQADGSLDRRLLRQTILASAQEKTWLEELLHPLILEDIQQQIKLSQGLYCMVEIPLLISKASYPFLNRILVVTTSEALQVARVMQRDHCSSEEALQIINAQANKALYLQYADDLLENNTSQQALREAARALHNLYLTLR